METNVVTKVASYTHASDEVKSELTVKTPFYGGAFYDGLELIYIKEIIYSNPATVVFWSDGTKTVAKCHKDDTYNSNLGVAVAVLKKIAGSKFASKLLEDWGEPEGKPRKTMTDVRKKHRKDK